MADSGFQVSPDELTSFASYLESTTAGEVSTAAGGVTSANGFDFSAFGLFLGQTLGVPSRIAMGVASSELKNLADKIKQTADDTRTTAQNYTQNDQDSAGSFDSMQKVLTVAEQLDVTDSNWSTGAGVIDSYNSLITDIKNAHDEDKAQAAVEIGVAAVGAVIDTVSAVLNPLSKLIAAGLGWLIEHVEFLRKPLDLIIGNPTAVGALATDLHKIGQDLRNTATDLDSEVSSQLANWTGQAADNYRTTMTSRKGDIDGAGQSVDTVGYVVETTMAIISAVRGLIRDMITSTLGDIISTMLIALATAPFTFGASIAVGVTKCVVEGVAKVAEMMAKLAKLLGFSAKAMKHIDDLVDAIKKAATKLDAKQSSLMDKYQAGKTGTPGTGTTGAAAADDTHPAAAGDDAAHDDDAPAGGGDDAPAPAPGNNAAGDDDATNGNVAEHDDDAPAGGGDDAPAAAPGNNAAGGDDAAPAGNAAAHDDDAAAGGDDEAEAGHDDGDDDGASVYHDAQENPDAAADADDGASVYHDAEEGPTGGDTNDAGGVHDDDAPEDPPAQQHDDTAGQHDGTGGQHDDAAGQHDDAAGHHDDAGGQHDGGGDGARPKDSLLKPFDDPRLKSHEDWLKKFGLGDELGKTKTVENYLKANHPDVFQTLKTISDLKSSKNQVGLVDKYVTQLVKQLGGIKENAQTSWDQANQQWQQDHPGAPTAPPPS